MGVQANRKIAIVAIHGVGPQQRYVTQDKVAEELATRLTEYTGATWTQRVFYPTVNQKPGAAQSYASALRVSRDDLDTGTVFDVYEGYWSPIDKGHTSLAAVLSWILKTIFVPLSTSARLPSGLRKLLFDGTYVAVAMLLLLIGITAAIFATTWGYAVLAPSKEPSSNLNLIATLFTSPLSIIKNFQSLYIGALLAVFGGIYLILQAANAIRLQWKYRLDSPHRRQRGYEKWRWVAPLLVIAAGAALLFLAYKLVSGRPNTAIAFTAFAIGAIALRLTLALAKDFFVNRIGDVQIYTTRDNNSELHTLRDDITETVQRTIQQVLDTKEPDVYDVAQPYERVYILGHSLGSTIAMDALIRLHQLVEGGTLTEDSWRRIRGFVTYGTALEKTKFFFDVAHPTLSQSYDQWRGEVYGHMFTDDPAKLNRPTAQSPHQIYWTNFWYFTDLVANEIVTYRDGTIKKRTAASGTAEICKNARLPSRFPAHVWVHSDYIEDDNLWTRETEEEAVRLLDIFLAEDDRPPVETGELGPEEFIFITEI